MFILKNCFKLGLSTICFTFIYFFVKIYFLNFKIFKYLKILITFKSTAIDYLH